VVLIGKSHKIGGDCGFIGLLEARETERAWDELSGCGIGWLRGLMRV